MLEVGFQNYNLDLLVEFFSYLMNPPNSLPISLVNVIISEKPAGFNACISFENCTKVLISSSASEALYKAFNLVVDLVTPAFLMLIRQLRDASSILLPRVGRKLFGKDFVL